MLDGALIINSIAHAYNLRDDNLQPNPYARGLRDLLVKLQQVWNPAETRVPPEIYMSDWPTEALARTLFLETDVDMAANMYLRLDSWFKDGLCSRKKNVEAAARWPNRFFTYVGVDPMTGLETCLKDLEEQKQELPGLVGLQLYLDGVSRRRYPPSPDWVILKATSARPTTTSPQLWATIPRIERQREINS